MFLELKLIIFDKSKLKIIAKCTPKNEPAWPVFLKVPVNPPMFLENTLKNKKSNINTNDKQPNKKT